MTDTLKAKNRRLFLSLALIVAGMVGMSYAAVPLYEIFCRVTGFGGTTQVASAPSGKVIDRVIKIRFDANLNGALPWAFQPVQREIALKVGKTGIAFYRARNDSGGALVGTATFNVTPLKAGQYFNKIDCFCFQEQKLKAGEQVDMPVTFFVDPEIVNDRNLDDVDTITLSYTFFEATGSVSSVAEPETNRNVN
ncbi:MAG TPA: cytochrome c oxidase assembly protein [Rhodospirillaceae bacterium]|nr:cytochrome c oxidase assembly protein [Rhodospirillaceae bacterium]HAT36001.1 cytochrome c oxidase assembly protein [Rhodospirillaceae bacterium]